VPVVKYEFGGPIGVTFVIIGLPFVIYALYFLCNNDYCLNFSNVNFWNCTDEGVCPQVLYSYSFDIVI